MDNPTEDYNKYDSEVEDIDEVTNTEIKINPDYYIHSAILKAQQCLVKDNAKEGFLQFIVLVEHIEVLCRAARMITQEYTDQLLIFKQTPEYVSEDQKLVKDVKLANKKIELLMIDVFSNKTISQKIKM